VPSSDELAKRGRVGWYATDRRALVWYLRCVSEAFEMSDRDTRYCFAWSV
jgi:hypothetical protein